MKKFLLTLGVVGAMSTSAFAGWCGEGKITDFMAGGWNTDNLYIQIDYSVSRGDHEGTEQSSSIGPFIVFKTSTLSADRLKLISAAALSAYMQGETIKVYSHNDRCDDATQIGLTK